MSIGQHRSMSCNSSKCSNNSKGVIKLTGIYSKSSKLR